MPGLGGGKDELNFISALGESPESGPSKEDAISHTLPAKYHGTRADQQDMIILGKKQVLRRNFKFITMLGFGSTVICSWEVILPVFSFVLYDGGTALLFWGFIAIGLGMMLVYASLAEMASMCPTAGGQYHWVSEFAPPKYQKILSYTTGWLCAGWQVFLASVAFMVGGIIQGLIALNNEAYGFEAWHATLLTIGIMVFAIFFNTFLAVRLPFVEGCILILHLAGFFAVFIPMWVLSPRAKASDVLLNFENNGGWPTTGLSSMIGLTAPLTALIGYDCSVHMSEELQDASITMPKAIMWTVGPNAAFGFLMAITLCFTVGPDLVAIRDTPLGQPFIQVFFNGTRSYLATNFMVGIVIVCLTSCCISEVATASRQLWSFARDNGLPASRWLSHVAPGWNIPMRAVLTSLVITSLLACINLGSATALNAINSLGGVSVLSSYIVTIGVLVHRRLFGPPLPPRRWSLGKFGLPINIAALCVTIPLWFFLLWPLEQPVTAVNMNWASTMYGGVMLFAIAYYAIWGRHVYEGPVMLVKRDE